MEPKSISPKFKLIGVGEILWDLLPQGRQLGGAPANFAYHANAFGAEGRIVSRIGSDALGREILERLESLGVASDCIELDDSAPTGTVTVEVGANGQPRFQIHENVAWDALSGEPSGRKKIAAADAVCFGSLAQRDEVSRGTIRSLVAGAPSKALRIFDVNLRQHYFTELIIKDSLALANVLKINDAELPVLKDLLKLTGDVRQQLAELASRYELSTVAYTRGEHGSLILSEGRWSDHPGERTKVADTVGAGDSFTAAMSLGLLAGWDLDLVNEQANRVAAYVCSCVGATPPLPLELRNLFAPAIPN